ncbi:Uncharacterised protein [Candidatus Tiddalikarchaeum anstoanum]|nr:Uncharacterised protein [Candidatus Tiddalikarchaeum anstoanum]
MNNKAITPVISTILLIMLVVAITGGAWYWMTSVQGNLQENAGSTIEQTSGMSATQFSIVSTICNATNNSVTVVLMNSGQQAFSATAKVISTLSSISGTVLQTDAAGVSVASLAAGTAQSIVLGLTYDIQPTTAYSVKLIIGSSQQTATCTAN